MPTQLHYLFCFALLLLSTKLSAQDFTKVDAQARATSFPKNQDISALAKTLGAGLTTEKEKVRAIYVWLTANIRYDVKTFENKKDLDTEERIALQDPEQVLKRKLAVCAGYSNLFCALCKASGIEAILVSGVSKNHRGRVSRIGHAWNLARADGQWMLIDATWGAGDVDTDEGKYTARFKEIYFNTPPETSILDHYPEDPLFQLLPTPLTLDEFKQERAQTKLSDQTDPNIRDSLNAFVQLDSAYRNYNSCMRMLRFDPTNSKGLYGLAMFHYNDASGNLRAVHEDMNRVAQNRGNKQQMTEALDRNIARLTTVEGKWNDCISTLERITGSGGLYRSARQMLGYTRKSLSESSKYKGSLEEMRLRVK